jgi:Sulfotransferase domain
MRKQYLAMERFVKSKFHALKARRRYRRARLQQQSLEFMEDGKLSLGEQLLFVTGFDKSGTTWLMNLFNCHPSIFCQGSGQFFNYFLEGVHFLADPGGYRHIANVILQNPWYKGSGHVWLTEQGVQESSRRIIMNSMLEFPAKEHTLLFGDKSTVQDCFLIREVFPKAHIVAIVRDGRDVAVSFAYHFKRRGKPTKFTTDGKLSEDHLVDVAKAWSLYNEHILKFKETGDERFSFLRYEDLLSDTESLIRGVFSALSVNAEPSTVREIVAKNSFERLSGGRKPGQEDPGSFFRKGVANDWKNHLSKSEADTFGLYASEMLRTFGYDLVGV